MHDSDPWSAGKQIVLAVSQNVAGVPAAEEPVADYRRFSDEVGGVIVGRPASAGSALERFEKAAALDIRHALSVVRDYPQADLYVSFSERVGIPLGVLLARRRRRPRHLMIAHRLNRPFKAVLSRLVGWQRGVDSIVVFCSSQLPYARRYAPSSLLRGCVTDDAFFSPQDGGTEDYVLSVGTESRDYETLTKAVSRLPCRLKIVAASPWSRTAGPNASASGGQVEYLSRMDYAGLRGTYARAKLVVAPLLNVDYAAGHNAVLEALCMGKPLLVTGSEGILDYVDHMRNAYVVPPADADSMAKAIELLLADRDLRSRLAANARADVQGFLNQRAYVAHLLDACRAVLEDRR